MKYPEEWNELPKRERKKKIKELKRKKAGQQAFINKLRNIAIAVVVIVIAAGGYRLATRKTPEEIALEQEIKEVSLEGKTEEFPIEGKDHVAPGTKVDYKTNPPTSGGHYASAADWGVYQEEIPDEAVVHSLEHGGIWISYKDIDEAAKNTLEEIGEENSGSAIVSPRSANEAKIAVVSWGRMMKLEKVDRALIQKYIDTYKNQSPERLAR